MEPIIQKSFRVSDVLLDRELNPTRCPHIGGATPAAIIEACGIIPDFFCEACCTAEPRTLDAIAAGMDAAYQFGGFAYPFGGHLTPAGVYQSDHDDDADLLPLCVYRFEHFECFVYDYGITAIRDRSTDQYKIARFD